MRRPLTSIALVLASLFCMSPGAGQNGKDAAANQGAVWNGVPRNIEKEALYLFYLHGKIVEQGLRPTSDRFGVYEYEQILETFKRRGFVVISEQRAKNTDVEEYARKVAGQVRELIAAGVPPRNITIVGASQGSWIAMLASTDLKNRSLNFVLIAACSADDGFLQLVDLHGNVLSIYERSDLAGSCQKYRADATGLGAYKELELKTGLKHGFLFRPLKEWVEPTVAWAREQSKIGGGVAVSKGN